jgi:hypothetical protein
LVAAIGCDATIFLVSWSTISSRYGNMCLIFFFNSRTPHSFHYLMIRGWLKVLTGSIDDLDATSTEPF